MELATTSLQSTLEHLDAGRLATLREQALAEGRTCIVDGVILDRAGRAFVMKRSSERRRFPGCWDLPGGRVERGETLEQALAREIREETGWRLRRLCALISVTDWQDGDPGRPSLNRQFDFVVDVEGDLTRPTLEPTFSDYRWVDHDALDLLSENRAPGDTLIAEAVSRALALVPRGRRPVA